MQSFNDETYAAISSRSPRVNALGAWSKVFARSAIGWADSGRNANSARIPEAPSGSGMWATGRLYWSDQIGAIVGNYYYNSQLSTPNAQLPTPNSWLPTPKNANSQLPKQFLVRFGHFGAVDDNNLNGAAFGLELETKVFAKSGQE